MKNKKEVIAKCIKWGSINCMIYARGQSEFIEDAAKNRLFNFQNPPVKNGFGVFKTLSPDRDLSKVFNP